ncbi:MAG: hypothetical protein FJ303_09470 [Planctomycetes bacterium]|nr:hypothetical protein [Planctomycetota bacterium]
MYSQERQTGRVKQIYALLNQRAGAFKSTLKAHETLVDPNSTLAERTQAMVVTFANEMKMTKLAEDSQKLQAALHLDSAIQKQDQQNVQRPADKVKAPARLRPSPELTKELNRIQGSPKK